jgi:hypothetical protein
MVNLAKYLLNFRSLSPFQRVMRLRTNQVLKIFALLLFSLEFLSPAFLVDFSNPDSRHDKVQLVDGNHCQNILYSIFAEEITENEEGREDHRETIHFSEINFASALLQLLGSKPVQRNYSSILSKQFETHPAIFKLNCNFLI